MVSRRRPMVQAPVVAAGQAGHAIWPVRVTHAGRRLVIKSHWAPRNCAAAAHHRRRHFAGCAPPLACRDGQKQVSADDGQHQQARPCRCVRPALLTFAGTPRRGPAPSHDRTDNWRARLISCNYVARADDWPTGRGAVSVGHGRAQPGRPAPSWGPIGLPARLRASRAGTPAAHGRPFSAN
jgi:hypothetical protein